MYAILTDRKGDLCVVNVDPAKVKCMVRIAGYTEIRFFANTACVVVHESPSFIYQQIANRKTGGVCV